MFRVTFSIFHTIPTIDIARQRIEKEVLRTQIIKNGENYQLLGKDT